MIRRYTTRPVHIEEEPEVAKIYSPSEGIIFINLDARQGANVVLLLNEGWRDPKCH